MSNEKYGNPLPEYREILQQMNFEKHLGYLRDFQRQSFSISSREMMPSPMFRIPENYFDIADFIKLN
jgi:hypothetical protein